MLNEEVSSLKTENESLRNEFLEILDQELKSQQQTTADQLEAQNDAQSQKQKQNEDVYLEFNLKQQESILNLNNKIDMLSEQ